MKISLNYVKYRSITNINTKRKYNLNKNSKKNTNGKEQ